MAHTPGPWMVGTREPYVEVWGPMRMNASPIIASLECQPRDANARLIAAAPELLAALHECEEYFDNRADADCDQDGFIPNKEMRLLTEVRAAIAKAEGK